MSFARKLNDGNWYVCIKKLPGPTGSVSKGFRSVFLVKAKHRGYVYLNNLILPKEFFGKKIRLKIEIETED